MYNSEHKVREFNKDSIDTNTNVIKNFVLKTMLIFISVLLEKINSSQKKNKFKAMKCYLITE